VRREGGKKRVRGYTYKIYRAEVKRMNLTFTERIEQYNAKCFPQPVAPVPEKEPQVPQTKEKVKRKKERVAK
jgi:hypothetical protein